MATIQLTVPNDEWDHFAEQARRAGKPLDAWLLDAARQQAGKPSADTGRRFKSLEELQAFSRGARRCRGRSGNRIGKTGDL